jgi:hypothetical protein
LPSDAEPGSLQVESGALLGSRVRPLSHTALSQRRSRRISLHTHETLQDADIENSGSEHGLDIPERDHDEDYCPSSSIGSGM